jgi:phosphoribosylglycinamide formyltransferase-1
VLVSGRGSNLRNLVELGFDVAAVATNRPSCPAATFVREQGIDLGEFSQKHFGSLQARDAAMAGWLQARGAELIVNAGYDRILSPEFTSCFVGRMLNIHPSLLPAFGGTMHAVEEALAHGVRITGCTVHLVTDDLDSGPILLQAPVPVREGDDPDSLRARIQAEEHRLLPQAIRLMEARLAGETSATLG